jgi:hypothetical protein
MNGHDIFQPDSVKALYTQLLAIGNSFGVVNVDTVGVYSLSQMSDSTYVPINLEYHFNLIFYDLEKITSVIGKLVSILDNGRAFLIGLHTYRGFYDDSVYAPKSTRDLTEGHAVAVVGYYKDANGNVRGFIARDSNYQSHGSDSAHFKIPLNHFIDYAEEILIDDGKRMDCSMPSSKKQCNDKMTDLVTSVGLDLENQQITFKKIIKIINTAISSANRDADSAAATTRIVTPVTPVSSNIIIVLMLGIIGFSICQMMHNKRPRLEGQDGGRSLYTKYKGKRYKVRTGDRGGKYIVVGKNKRKVYVA